MFPLPFSARTPVHDCKCNIAERKMGSAVWKKKVLEMFCWCWSANKMTLRTNSGPGPREMGDVITFLSHCNYFCRSKDDGSRSLPWNQNENTNEIKEKKLQGRLLIHAKAKWRSWVVCFRNVTVKRDHGESTREQQKWNRPRTSALLSPSASPCEEKSVITLEGCNSDLNDDVFHAVQNWTVKPISTGGC